MEKPINIFELNVQEPWKFFIFNGQKTIEGRRASPKWNSVKEKDQLIIDNIIFIVVAVRRYTSIKEYLEAEGLNKTLPGIQTIEKGIEVYENIYYKQKIEGMVAMEIKKL
ncbi:MAG TPA: ASCH domain-containing protein [Saprospiraceae bacterium]|nr:ASCH domain-containing protein [Saprospiraceae bacterium]